MGNMESTGIPTRFPHPSHIYKIFASKEWTAQMCLHPMLNVPLTTQVSRQAVVCDPAKAAIGAIRALGHLSEVRAAWGGMGGSQEEVPRKAVPVQRGVAKL